MTLARIMARWGLAMVERLSGTASYYRSHSSPLAPPKEKDMTTCPTCGGPCTWRVVMVGGDPASAEYESLVKGEVVAEGWAFMDKYSEAKWVLRWNQEESPGTRYGILVIRQKEEPMTSERTNG